MLAQDNKGQTVYDVLKEFGNKNRGELSRDEVIHLEEVKKLLRQTMTGHNPQLSAKISKNVTCEPGRDLHSSHSKRGHPHEPSRRKRSNDFRLVSYVNFVHLMLLL